MSDTAEGLRDLPPTQHIPADQVIRQLSDFGRERIDGLGITRTMVLAVMGGAFITVGALFSVILGAGFESPGARLLVEGFGFSVGFFFVVLAEAALFTEANVVMPATLLEGTSSAGRVVRFWVLALFGNLFGALLIGWLISLTHPPTGEVAALLAETIEAKMSFREIGGVEGWSKLILSGILANWLVGMAAFFATMGRTIIGKYIPVLLAVTMFVSAGFQHSPANMGYFSLSMANGGGPGWGPALFWDLLPVGIGNVIGGTLLVALPFWLVFGRDD
jgi:formate/nitrite transporter